MPDAEKPYNAGDTQSVRERTTAARRSEASQRIMLREIMGSNEGRAWFYKILSLCHVYQTSFSPNALAMAFAEGERSVGLRLMADLVEAAPAKYLEMLAEQGDKNV